MGYYTSWFKPGFQTQLAITINCLHAFFLFGYDQGVFGGLISNSDFLDIVNHPSDAFLGFIVSSYNLGCLSGCAINFLCGSMMGRRHVLWLAMALISAGAVLQAAAYGVPQMLVGRIVTGLGVGIDTSTVPMYQAELCKSNVRGRLVTTEVLFTALGIAVAYFFAFGMDFVGGAIAWRLPIAIQIVPVIIISIVLLGLPETPRWLIEKGRVDEAERVMCQVYGGGPDDEYIRTEKAAILEALELENQAPFRWANVFQKDRVQTGWRVILAVLSLTFNQLSGINVVVFYIATVLQVNVGLSRTISLIAGGCINLAFAVGSLVPGLFLDRIGRRKPMIIGTIGMAFTLMTISILISFRGTDKEGPTSQASIAFFVIRSFHSRQELKALLWLLMVNWILVFSVVMVTPTMISNIAWKTYLVFMSFNFAIAPIIYFIFPETNRLSLEEIDHLFIKDEPIGLSPDSGEKDSRANGSGESTHVN